MEERENMVVVVAFKNGKELMSIVADSREEGKKVIKQTLGLNPDYFAFYPDREKERKVIQFEECKTFMIHDFASVIGVTTIHTVSERLMFYKTLEGDEFLRSLRALRRKFKFKYIILENGDSINVEILQRALRIIKNLDLYVTKVHIPRANYQAPLLLETRPAVVSINNEMSEIPLIFLIAPRLMGEKEQSISINSIIKHMESDDDLFITFGTC